MALGRTHVGPHRAASGSRGACGGAVASGSVFNGLARLPHFNPDDDTDPLDPAVVDLRSAIDMADGLLLSTPEYAGALPDSFKNLLDWLVGGVEISRKPTGWINASSSPTGAAGAHASVRTVLGYVDADVVDAACAHIPVRHDAIGPDRTITEPAIRTQIAAVVHALADHALSTREPGATGTADPAGRT